MAPPLLADLPARNNLRVSWLVYVQTDPGHHISGTICSRQPGIENELCHPRCRLNLGFENI
jgi:hypothetical protein